MLYIEWGPAPAATHDRQRKHALHNHHPHTRSRPPTHGPECDCSRALRLFRAARQQRCGMQQRCGFVVPCSCALPAVPPASPTCSLYTIAYYSILSPTSTSTHNLPPHTHGPAAPAGAPEQSPCRPPQQPLPCTAGALQPVRGLSVIHRGTPCWLASRLSTSTLSTGVDAGGYPLASTPIPIPAWPPVWVRECLLAKWRVARERAVRAGPVHMRACVDARGDVWQSNDIAAIPLDCHRTCGRVRAQASWVLFLQGMLAS